MTKEIENQICSYCESEFKLIFVSEEVSSLPKFCPFCGSETFGTDGIDNDQELYDSYYEDTEEPEL